MKAQLRVSEAAQLVGVSPSTLRAWESSGLVTPSRQGRYRRFSPNDVKRLQRLAVALGISVSDLFGSSITF